MPPEPRDRPDLPEDHPMRHLAAILDHDRDHRPGWPVWEPVDALADIGPDRLRQLAIVCLDLLDRRELAAAKGEIMTAFERWDG